MINGDTHFNNNDVSLIIRIRTFLDRQRSKLQIHISRWLNLQKIEMNNSLQVWTYNGPIIMRRKIRINYLMYNASGNQSTDSGSQSEHKGHSDIPMNIDQLTLSTKRKTTVPQEQIDKWLSKLHNVGRLRKLTMITCIYQKKQSLFRHLRLP